MLNVVIVYKLMIEFRKLKGNKIDGGLVRKTTGKRRSLV